MSPNICLFFKKIKNKPVYIFKRGGGTCALICWFAPQTFITGTLNWVEQEFNPGVPNE